jgi:hypothetical protein
MLPRILYIAGYSRSGSTLVDMVLNSSARITSTGELTYLHDDARAAKRLCTCGAAYGHCATYGGWLARRPADEGAVVRSVERRSALGRLVAGTVTGADVHAYRAYGQSLFGHIAETTGAGIVVDSSKSARDAAGRPLALSRLAGLDIRVLHLTRDPSGTVQSYMERGSNWVMEGHRAKGMWETWRPIPGWVLANRIARRLGREIGADRYLHLRFEDFLADPTGALDRIGALIGADLKDAAQQVADRRPFAAGHVVGGNRARLTPQKISPGASPPPRLPRAHALCLGLIARPLARELGYG